MVYHYRRLILGILTGILLALLILVPTTSVKADDAEVNITVSAWVVGNPLGFTVTWISDQQLDLSWTLPEAAVNVMVRSATGRPPENRVDGNLIYYGSDTSCSDTGISLDETVAAVYYRAWSETAEGVWSPLYSEGQMEGIGMVLIAIILLCAMVSYFSLRSSNILLGLAASITWIFFFVFTRENPMGNVTTGSFADELIVYLCWIFAIILPLIAIFRGRRERRYFGSSGTSVEWGETRRLTQPEPEPRKVGLMEMTSGEYRRVVRGAVRYNRTKRKR